MKSQILKVDYEYEQWEIDDGNILLERRHYCETLGTPYQSFVFLSEQYVCNQLDLDSKDLKLDLAGAKPLFREEKFYDLSVLFNRVRKYPLSVLLTDIFLKAETFYDVALLFPFIKNFVGFTDNQLDSICRFCLNKDQVRKCFAVNELMMISFLHRNRVSIDRQLYNELLEAYPLTR